MNEEIEEEKLYDDFKKNLDIQKVNKEIEELQFHPLFMNEQEQLNKVSSESVEALRSLFYDEEPETIAWNLINQGNKIMKEKILSEETL